MKLFMVLLAYLANTGTNVSVLFFDKSKSADKVILIDASKMGEEYQDGKNKKIRLRDDEIEKIIETFNKKETVDDFSVAVTYDDIKEKNYSLSAGQYFEVKIEYIELTEEEFNEKMATFTSNLEKYFEEGKALEKEIMERLGELRYE